MEKKIFISGPSGAGKTTLAKYISQRYRIPFVDGSSKVLWEKLEIKSHQDLIDRGNQDPNFSKEFQLQLLEYRKKATMGLESFVTDRSPLDNLVYYMMQQSHRDITDATKSYIKSCKDSLPYDGFTLFFLPMNVAELEDDGMRVNNVFYQMLTQGLFQFIINENWLGFQDDELSKIITINDWDWDKRISVVEKTFKPLSLWQNIKTRF